MLIVAALGGNALLRRGEPLSASTQRANIKQAVSSLAALVHAGHQLVITHGNGPQVGLLALQTEAGNPEEAYPLDVLGAETSGMIGYVIEQELENVLQHKRIVATLLTQVEVSPNDPAFKHPSKFIGPVYTGEQAKEKSTNAGWHVARDGEHWRRVVPSPVPVDIPDVRVIQLLLEQKVIVICTGGGGIPVVQMADGSLQGIEAVIDKDAASALLAQRLNADALLLLTDVDAVYRDFGQPTQTPITSISHSDIRSMGLPAGSMGPKVNAACNFVQHGGLAGIGRLDDALAILNGSSGTRIVEDS